MLIVTLTGGPSGKNAGFTCGATGPKTGEKRNTCFHSMTVFYSSLCKCTPNLKQDKKMK